MKDSLNTHYGAVSTRKNDYYIDPIVIQFLTVTQYQSTGSYSKISSVHVSESRYLTYAFSVLSTDVYT